MLWVRMKYECVLENEVIECVRENVAKNEVWACEGERVISVRDVSFCSLSFRSEEKVNKPKMDEGLSYDVE